MAGLPEVNQVADFTDDSAQGKRRSARFSQIVSQILNALITQGFIVRTNDKYQFTFVGGGSFALTLSDGVTTVTNVNDILFTTGATLSTPGAGQADIAITGGGGGGSDPISSIYPAFTPTGSSDEFSGGSFSGWTAVNSGSHNPTVTQANNVASLLHPGGDASGEMHAYVKSPTITAGSFVECGLKGFGNAQNFNVCGLCFADGTTYGSGNQAVWYMNFTQTIVTIAAWTGFNSQGTLTAFLFDPIFLASDLFMRMVYNGANSWTGFVSCDGVSWLNMTGNVSITLTPNVAGFWVSTYGGADPFLFSFRYVKFN